ncbi:MAG TPA: hypothetical protein VGH28_03935 [Polyangiaceae bacterium]
MQRRTLRRHFRSAHVPVGKVAVHVSHGDYQSQSGVDVSESGVAKVTLTLP